MVILSKLINLEQLRVHVGRPTTDTDDDAFVEDDDLQEIIHRHATLAEGAIRARLAEILTQGNISPDTVKHAAVTVTAGTPYATGTLPDRYFPIGVAEAKDASGNLYTPDPNMIVNRHFPFAQRRYRLVGNQLQVYPSAAGTITVPVMDIEEVSERLGSDILERANANIIQEAREMLAALIIEGQRLRGAITFGTDEEQ